MSNFIKCQFKNNITAPFQVFYFPLRDKLTKFILNCIKGNLNERNNLILVSMYSLTRKAFYEVFIFDISRSVIFLTLLNEKLGFRGEKCTPF